MDCVHHPSNNFVLGPPADGSMPDCLTISATMVLTDEGPVIATFWELTPEEVHKIRNGGKIKLLTWGGGFPPTAMEVVDAE